MKKLLLISVMLLSFNAFTQEAFTRNYKKIYVNQENKEELRYDGNVTAVFENNEVIIYNKDIVDHYYQVNDVEEGSTTGGDKYQLIKCVVKESGKTIHVQLFTENDSLRIIYADGYVEFYN
jgi:predicted membrane protein